VTKFSVRSLATLFALALAAGTAAAQTTVTLKQTEAQVTDSTIGSGTAAAVVSNTDRLTTRTSTDVNATRRALLKFDTENYVPANATIQSAKLSVFLKAGAGDAARRIAAYDLTESFQETQATWKTRKTGYAWRTVGGSVGVKAGEAVASTLAGTAITIDVTKLVQARVNAGASRYTRIALVDVDAADSTSVRDFHSSEAINPAVRPTLTVVYGAPAVASVAAVTSTSTLTSTLRVLHWNTHHGGVRMDGKYDPAGLVKWIVSFKPDVASLNEVENLSQVTQILSQLKSQTGVTWGSQWDGRGNLLVSRRAINAKSTCLVNAGAGRKAAHISIMVNGRPVNIWSTHLALDSSSVRVSETRALQVCERNELESRIVAGDFNMQADTAEYKSMTEGHVDAWRAAKTLGTATNYPGNGDGCTRNSRIDFVFTSKGATNLVLKSAQIFDTRNASGVMASDHKPMLVTYTAK
jgi:endonuclease/exonuclease/phosphatase family metal-dependent hydrolase